MGRELVSNIKFSTDAGGSTLLAETSEFMRICQEEENFPYPTTMMPAPSCCAKVEGLFLEVNELVVLKNSLESLNAIMRFFNTKQEIYPIW
ncbi:MAG: hypothetical protein ACLTZT_13350 [Butyricimonas faecalis]